jgi:hypothetical protein
MTPTTCRVFWSVAISPQFDGPPPEAQVAFAIGVLDEDRRMCENQVPAEVPMGPESCRLVAADRLAMTFRRSFTAFCERHHPRS